MRFPESQRPRPRRRIGDGGEARSLDSRRVRRLQVAGGRGVKELMAGEGSSLKDGRESLRESSISPGVMPARSNEGAMHPNRVIRHSVTE